MSGRYASYWNAFLFFKSVNRHRAEISLPIGLVDSNIVESSQQTVAYHHLR